MSSFITDYPASCCLLVITIGVSLLAFSNPKLFELLALEPFKMVRTHQYHPIITSGFVHANLSHLALNMLTLYFFGPNLEQLTAAATGGRGAFLIIYMASLVAGSLYPFFKYRNQPEYVAIGASGAISGVVFSYVLARPTDTFYIFFAIPIPAFLFAILYTAYSIYAMRNVEDNIGHEAHLAGAIGGMVATVLVAPDIVTIFR